MGVIPHSIMNEPKLKTKRLYYMNLTNEIQDYSNNLVTVPDQINNIPWFLDNSMERQINYLLIRDNLYFYTTDTQYDIIDVYILFGALLLLAYFTFTYIILIDYKKS